jgi:hypothetical protein
LWASRFDETGTRPVSTCFWGNVFKYAVEKLLAASLRGLSGIKQPLYGFFVDAVEELVAKYELQIKGSLLLAALKFFEHILNAKFFRLF